MQRQVRRKNERHWSWKQVNPYLQLALGSAVMLLFLVMIYWIAWIAWMWKVGVI